MQATVRAARRESAERSARLSALRLVATASLLRAGASRLLPRTGAAGWWTTLVCALPSLAVYLLLWGGMRLSGEQTLSAALRARRGSWAEKLLGVVTALCLAVEGAASMITLVTLLDEGVGVAVSPLMLAAGTAAVLCCCLIEGGLARGVQLLRWVMAAMLLWLLWEAVPQLRADNLFPFLGRGAEETFRAALPCAGAMWPVVLLLQVEAPDTRRCSRGWCAPVAAQLVLLAVVIVIPHEVLILRTGLAEGLLAPAHFLSALGRTLLMCLWILVTALSCVVCASGAARAVRGFHAPWLAAGLLAVFAAVQGFGAEGLVAALRAMQPWLLLPWVMIAAVLCFPRRRKQ